MITDHKQSLLHKLNSRTAAVAVIGLGYVGLPLAVAFVELQDGVSGKVVPLRWRSES